MKSCTNGPTHSLQDSSYPSGFLHMGNGLNFVLTYLLTKAQSGKLILRIDDLDQQRMRTEYLDDIFFTLDSLGIEWDEGPFGVEDHLNNHSQLHRLSLYQNFLQHLLPYAFACDCSRKKVQEMSTDGQYPGTCRKKELMYQTQITSLRIITQEKPIHWEDFFQENISVNLSKQMRDFVIKKKDGMPSYQLASLADDLSMKVNLIVRGADLIPSTAAQLFLSQLMGQSGFSQARFLHHPLVTDPQGQKLSKSEGALALRNWLKYQGVEQYYGWLCEAWGIEEKIGSLGELLELVKERGWKKFLHSIYGDDQKKKGPS